MSLFDDDDAMSPCLTLHSCCGSCVLRSQKRRVVSPDPVASRLPSGLNCVTSTDSECPAIEAVQRATGRTLNTAWGMYTTRSDCSTDTAFLARYAPSSPDSSCTDSTGSSVQRYRHFSAEVQAVQDGGDAVQKVRQYARP